MRIKLAPNSEGKTANNLLAADKEHHRQSAEDVAENFEWNAAVKIVGLFFAWASTPPGGAAAMRFPPARSRGRAISVEKSKVPNKCRR